MLSLVTKLRQTDRQAGRQAGRQSFVCEDTVNVIKKPNVTKSMLSPVT